MMASSLKSFAQQIRYLANNLPQQGNEIRKQVARTVDFDLLQTTPVDSGQAVSNWQVTLNTPAEGVRPAFAPSPEGYMKQTSGVRAWAHRVDPEATRQANIAPAMEVANQTIDAAQPDDVVHITNNLPYIQALDEGHSSQAENFVDRAILLASDVVKRANILR
jgi:hypothetical protein